MIIGLSKETLHECDSLERALSRSELVWRCALLRLTPPPNCTGGIRWQARSETGSTQIAAKFNASQTEFKVTPVYKGQYDESMTAAIAAYRAGNAPNILQVFEVGTATMMSAKGAIVPVYKLMADAHEPFDPHAYIAPVAGYYSDASGNMLSMPFNSSTVVFYYNKDAFKKAGLADKAPVTWAEVETDAKKIKASGGSCGFTTGWQSWAQLENFSAWHNLPFASMHNGLGGPQARAEFNGPLQIRHIEDLSRMAKEGTFTYAGRKDEPLAKFTNADCAMIMTSSGSYATIKSTAKFEFAVAPMPYYPDVKGAPQNAVIGGASLWVMAGKTPEEYKGVAQFLTYLSSTDNQIEWHEGYRLRADHDCGLRSGPEIWVLSDPPGFRRGRKGAAEQATHGKYRRSAAWQLSSDQKRHRRGTRVGVERYQDLEASARHGGRTLQRHPRQV